MTASSFGPSTSAGIATGCSRSDLVAGIAVERLPGPGRQPRFR